MEWRGLRGTPACGSCGGLLIGCDRRERGLTGLVPSPAKAGEEAGGPLRAARRLEVGGWGPCPCMAAGVLRESWAWTAAAPPARAPGEEGRGGGGEAWGRAVGGASGAPQTRTASSPDMSPASSSSRSSTNPDSCANRAGRDAPPDGALGRLRILTGVGPIRGAASRRTGVPRGWSGPRLGGRWRGEPGGVLAAPDGPPAASALKAAASNWASSARVSRASRAAKSFSSAKPGASYSATNRRTIEWRACFFGVPKAPALGGGRPGGAWAAGSRSSGSKGGLGVRQGRAWRVSVGASSAASAASQWRWRSNWPRREEIEPVAG